MEIEIKDAFSRMNEVIERMEKGEEVLLDREGSPVARLTPYRKHKRSEFLGFYEGKVRMEGDLFEPLSDEILKEFYK